MINTADLTPPIASAPDENRGWNWPINSSRVPHTVLLARLARFGHHRGAIPFMVKGLRPHGGQRGFMLAA